MREKEIQKNSPPSGFFPGWDSSVADKNLSVELLHVSGSGITRLYRSRSDGRNRLYKVLSPDCRNGILYESLLRKEFEIGYSLTHPGICATYAYTRLEELGPAIEMEWVEGCTLREWMGRNPSRKQREAVVGELLDALAYMHRKQVVHRDLKPENIMITDRGAHVKIIDFGFSDSDAHALNKGPAGTRAYAAPELLSGKQTDQRSDIWSFGRILKELLPPYRKIARKCMAPSPEDRYPDIPALQKAIARRRRLWIVPVCLAAALLLGTALWFRPHGDADVDALVRKAEESISATISSEE